MFREKCLAFYLGDRKWQIEETVTYPDRVSKFNRDLLWWEWIRYSISIFFYNMKWYDGQ